MNRAPLQAATSNIDRERSYLCEERSAFEAFREVIRLIHPDQDGDSGQSKTAEKLREAYRREVMETLDYEVVYGDTLAESLEQELSPALANTLLSGGPITQKHKRNLLVTCSDAIARRTRVREKLDAERDILEAIGNELTMIETAIDELPKCDLQSQPLEDLLVIWEFFDRLEKRCAQLLADRQRQLEGTDQSIRVYGETHALNRHLYGDLETAYPVLSALAETLARIDSKRHRETPLEVAEGSV